MTDDALIEAMQRPEFYPHGPANVTVVQTHISYVFLAGSEVYKIKKAVRFPFLDFATLERRRFFCHEEVRLNRRLAREVYRGVVAIRREGGGLRLADDGDGAVEYAVHMRRLPEDRILAGLLDRGEASPALIDALVDLLAKFHAAARTDDEIVAAGSPHAVARLLEDNFSNARRFRGRTLAADDDDAIQAFSRRFLATHEALLRRRQQEGRIRECHGDLHSEHVCCTDPIVIFDCIEFNQTFRNCDVAAEIAFLKMDLDFHDHGELAERLVARYAEAARDPELPSLMPLYACYRAYVRGLVDSLTAAEGEVAPADREDARRRAERHFALAYRYTWAPARVLLVVSGLSGSGKSTLSEALRRRTGFVHVNSDRVRKRLAGIGARERLMGDDAAQLYAPEMSARTYATMHEEASTALQAGRSVIIDGTFQRVRDRQAARDLARRHGTPILIVECDCDEDEIRRRLSDRKQKGDDASDADWDVYVEQRCSREPIGAEEACDVLRVDTAQPCERLVSLADRRRQSAGALAHTGGVKMSEFQTICVGIDDGHEPEVLLETAARLASSFRAKVWLITVVEPVRLYQRILKPVQSHAHSTDEIAARATERLGALAAQERFRDVPIDFQVQVGVPFADLIAAARNVHADLIMAGAYVRAETAGSPLGKTAERVLRKSSIPVLLVRRPFVPARSILAPTDFSEASMPALRRAAFLARLWNARLLLLHVIEPLTQAYVWPAQAAPIELFIAEPDEVEPEWAALLQSLDLDGVQVEHRTLKGFAASSIVRAASEESSDLIVMGTHGRSGLMHILLGSVAESVARQVPCSLLTLRPDEFQFELP